MTTVAELAAVSVNFESGCRVACHDFAEPLYKQLASGRYDVCSTLAIPETLEDWRQEHRTARKRADRAERLGYHFAEIARHEWADDILEINTSTPERQGRPMSESYFAPPSTTPDFDYPCLRHGVHTYGVVSDSGRLRAYLWCYRAGDLALVSSILGHAAHLRDEIMYLLFAGALGAEIANGPGVFVYNRHDSGTDGLRFFKERLGFEAAFVQWELA